MIDLRSDTVTQPDEAMRSAMASAEVGDDVYGEDPTVNELESVASDVLGTEAALFCPSGTMANQIALDVWTEPGDELLLEQSSHIYSYEVGGAARLAGLQTRPIDGGGRGVIDPESVETSLRTKSLHVAGTGLLALENTHNNLGGRALTVGEIADPASVAHEHDIPVHLDGARLWNAAIAHDVTPDVYVEHVDSVMVSLSKGLGAPVGSILASDEGIIDQARRTRKSFGGGMRQAGVLAAAGLLAIDRRVELSDDHRLARSLADGIGALDGVDVIEPETNIVIASIDPKIATADEWLAGGAELNVYGTDVGRDRVRYVTHRDVTAADIEVAIERLHELHRSFA